MREQIIERVKNKKIVVIVRGVYGEDCLNLAKAPIIVLNHQYRCLYIKNGKYYISVIMKIV